MRGAAAPLTAASYLKPELIAPTNPDWPLILYIDANKRLQVGTWVTTNNGQVTSNNILQTQFGSTVAFTQVSNTDGWTAGDIKFNPTSTLNATWENGTTGWGLIPGWVSWPGTKPASNSYSTTTNVDFISKSPYHTLQNVKAGFGDICQLVGYTVENIAEWDELPPPTYRLPTNPENNEFVGYSGVAADNVILGSTYGRWTSGSPGYMTYPSSTPPNLVLTGAGERVDSGAGADWGTGSGWWSSTPNFYHIWSGSASLIPSCGDISRHGHNVRCVRVDP